MAETTLGPRDELLARQIELYRRQAFWEPWKAVAALAAAGAVFFGFVLATSQLIHPRPQEITVHLSQPLAVQILPR